VRNGPLQPVAACVGDLDGDGAPEVILATRAAPGTEPEPIVIARKNP
jgi:hypothetical protein